MGDPMDSFQPSCTARSRRASRRIQLSKSPRSCPPHSDVGSAWSVGWCSSQGFLTRYSHKFEETDGWIVGEGLNRGQPVPHRALDIVGGTVAQAQPDHFGWKPVQHTHVAEVGVFRDDDVVVGLGLCPDGQIGGPIQAHQEDMAGAGIEISKPVHQPGREVMIEEQSHTCVTSSCRSRSAA